MTFLYTFKIFKEDFIYSWSLTRGLNAHGKFLLMSNHSVLCYNSGFFLLLLLEVTESNGGVLCEKRVMCVHQGSPKLCSRRPFLLNFPLAPVFCSCPHFCTLLIL